MNDKKINLSQLLPVMFTFFVMGFCDVVGIAASHVKEDFLLSDKMAKMIPVVLFSMFLFFSIPTGMLMNRIGRKRTVLLSNVLTTVALFIPFISYTYASSLCAFMLLGVANTILQVSLNPLMSNVVQGDRLASSLTTGQFIKAISSFSAQPIALFCATQLGHWEYIFPVFAVVTLISTFWLLSVNTPQETEKGTPTTFREVFSMLSDMKILLLFLGIVFVVGVDVGVNTVAPELLKERVGLDADHAGFGSMIYFAFRTLGAFSGAFILTRYSHSGFFRSTIIVAVATIAAMIFVRGEYVLYTLYAITGLTMANVFAILFSWAIRHRPEKANEISGLMITGVFGGAIVSFLMGVVSDAVQSQTGSVAVILICACYLLFCSFALSGDRTVKRS